ncbi:MAG TPA: potassium channel family protein, partial [Vicinamibacterales bacterium]
MLQLLAGLLLIGVVLWDGFETIVLPRTVSRKLRIARLYFRGTWSIWSAAGRRARSDATRERFLAIYGPFSLLGLLLVWAAALVVGFAILHLAAHSPLARHDGLPATFVDDLYMSGTTFVTLGLGDVYPTAGISRFFTVAEAGTGFGFLALAIAYFPVLYQSFSRREARLTLLDAWAGSPPAAGEVLRRLAEAREIDALQAFLKDWEYWSSELLESHISYPIVAFFRSQHQRQSWVSALTTVLDVSALVIAGADGVPAWQARVTFAIARHAAVDLTQVLGARPDRSENRLSRGELEELRAQLGAAGLRLSATPESDASLAELRRSYEPYVL